jgi:hypothetical protein
MTENPKIILTILFWFIQEIDSLRTTSITLKIKFKYFVNNRCNYDEHTNVKEFGSGWLHFSNQ